MAGDLGFVSVAGAALAADGERSPLLQCQHKSRSISGFFWYLAVYLCTSFFSITSLGMRVYEDYVYRKVSAK